MVVGGLQDWAHRYFQRLEVPILLVHTHYTLFQSLDRS
jgi:hypothetical protein